MKISILLESFQPEYWGGRETRWKNLIELLSESHQLVIYGDFSRISSDIAFPGVRAKFINIGVLPPMYGSNGNRSLKHAVMYTSKAYKILFSKSDILLIDQTPLISIPIVRFFCLLSRTKLSVTWHEVWSLQTWFRYSRLLGIFGVLLQEIALLFSKNIVVPSVEVAADLEKRLFSRKSIVIANGAKSTLHMRRVNLNQAKNSSVQLLYVGRLIKHKNCDFLVDVMELASGQGKNWKLTIIGIGPLEGRLRELVGDKKLQECITFKSNVPEIELMDQYSKSDIFVFPSQREGYGISVAEAISHELPVIVYDCPENAATSLVQTRASGLKVKNLETSVWFAAIEEILLNKDSKQLQSQVKIAKWESIATEYSKFLNSLM